MQPDAGAAGAPSVDGRLVVFPDAQREILMERPPVRARFVALVKEFLGEALAGTPQEAVANEQPRLIGLRTSPLLAPEPPRRAGSPPHPRRFAIPITSSVPNRLSLRPTSS